MKNNFSSCVLVKFEPQKELRPDLLEFLDAFFEVNATNYLDNGFEEYVGYAKSDFNHQKFQEEARKLGIVLPAWKTEPLENKNWLTENVIKFPPIETEDFCIYGIHEKSAPKTSKIAIKIYAATAFGSGHQTTVGCLQAISHINKTKSKPQKVLDMGTGSGILSLGCATLWGKNGAHITAVDMDEEAIRVTTQNAIDNKLQEYLTIEQSEGYNAKIVSINSPYDLILANILARPLIQMAPQLADHLTLGGHCIISGFTDEQYEWVVSAHTKHGLHVVKNFKNDNWCSVLMEKIR